jgi:hypothetical protein
MMNVNQYHGNVFKKKNAYKVSGQAFGKHIINFRVGG